MMKLNFLGILLVFLFSMNAFADIHPKTVIKFYCSEDNRELLVTDGTTISIIEKQWSLGEPAGCTNTIVSSVTRSGYYCDGHWLYQYNGGQVDDQENNSQQNMGTTENCQQQLSSEPTVDWN